MSKSFGCRRALCHTGCIRDGQITRDLFNSVLADELLSSNMKYLSELVLPVLLRKELFQHNCTQRTRQRDHQSTDINVILTFQ